MLIKLLFWELYSHLYECLLILPPRGKQTMSSKKYEPNELSSILDSLFAENASGVLCLKTQAKSWLNPRSCILILRNGALVYGDLDLTKAPTNQEICHKLGQKLKPELINAALSVASQKINSPTSTRQLIELLCKMKVFTWQQVEAFVSEGVILTLERFIARAGIAQWQASNDCDLDYDADNHGLNWLGIEQQLKQRQQQWENYSDLIPDMDAIPVVTAEQFARVSNSQVKEHFRNSVDGKNTLIDIADKLGRDSLKVAKNYYEWSKNGWVEFVQAPAIVPSIASVPTEPANSSLNASESAAPSIQSQDKENLPIVLSVDDSPIIQTAIKRALQEQYNVLLADKAAEALRILNQHSVQLLLLDLTMPDIDGLQFCKTIRQIPKFQDLPIVMVTARDGFVNKAKGHLAGTSKYLTKPFKPEELREVVSQYIKK